MQNYKKFELFDTLIPTFKYSSGPIALHFHWCHNLSLYLTHLIPTIYMTNLDTSFAPSKIKLCIHFSNYERQPKSEHLFYNICNLKCLQPNFRALAQSFRFWRPKNLEVTSISYRFEISIKIFSFILVSPLLLLVLPYHF